MKELTTLQQRWIRTIVESWEEHRYETFRSLSSKFAVSSLNTAVCHVRALAQKGYVFQPYEKDGVYMPTRKAVLEFGSKWKLAEEAEVER